MTASDSNHYLLRRFEQHFKRENWHDFDLTKRSHLQMFGEYLQTVAVVGEIKLPRKTKTKTKTK